MLPDRRFAIWRVVLSLSLLAGLAILWPLYTTHGDPIPITLHSFNGSDGARPSGGLVQGSDGNFYGTTIGYIPNGAFVHLGTIFKITPGGNFTKLHTFSTTDGAIPLGGLVEGSDGNFYGTTHEGGGGGVGNVFKVTPNGGFETLHYFNYDNVDGSYPDSGLAQGSDCVFYGTTEIGGEYDSGTVYRITCDGTYTQLYSFNSIDGHQPVTGVVVGHDGSVYGTTTYGGVNNQGRVFKLTPPPNANTVPWNLTAVHDFNGSEGTAPVSLLQDHNGNLYGTTAIGGTMNLGTLFKLSPPSTPNAPWNFSVLRNDGVGFGMTLGSNGIFYGSRSAGLNNGATIFKMNADGVLETLYSFSDEGGFLPSAPVRGIDGNLYGTTGRGGSYDFGTIYSLPLPPEPTPTPTPEVDFSVRNIRAIQVVDDAATPLVRNKPAVVRIAGHADNSNLLLPAQEITFLVFLGDMNTALARATKTVSELNIDSAGDFTADVQFTPATPGVAVPLVVEIFPLSDESQTDNNWSSALPVKITTTRDLVVAYMPVQCSAVGLNSYGDTVRQAKEYLAGVFPLAPDQIGSKELTEPVSAPGLGGGCEFWPLLLARMWVLGRLEGAERTVFVADDKYMDDQFGTTKTGWGGCGVGSVIVRDGNWDTVPHELGHSYGLTHPWSNLLQFGPCWSPPGPYWSGPGYWVEKGVPIQTNLDSLMGYVDKIPTFPFPNRWINAPDYNRLLTQTFAVSPDDPEVLLVAGVAYRDGRVELVPSYRLQAGTPRVGGSGGLSLQVLDSANRIIARSEFDVSFTGFDERPGDPSDVNAVPFTVESAYPAGATAIQLVRNGSVLVRINIAPKLLRDAIAALPDAAFTRNPTQMRNALLNKVDAFDAQLAGGAKAGARNKLRNDIRKSLTDWLVDSYITHSKLEYTKQQVLDLVDELLGRLQQ
jgi:uncharacterized repeat protein (TIGR03803 family)